MVCGGSMSIKKKKHDGWNTPISRLALNLFLLHMLILTGCAPAMYDASFKGKVVDSDTREPIEGAVVLAIWTTWMMTPAGEVDKYYDCYEKRTDKNGDFFIPGKGPRVMSNLNPMTVNIIKAGYNGSSGTLGNHSRYQLKQSDKIIIMLTKITPEQRRSKLSPTQLGPAPPPLEAPIEKVKEYLLELNKYRIDRGLPPIKEWNGN